MEITITDGANQITTDSENDKKFIEAMKAKGWKEVSK